MFKPFDKLHFYVVPNFFVLEHEEHQYQVSKLIGEYKKPRTVITNNNISYSTLQKKFRHDAEFNSVTNFEIINDTFIECIYSKFHDFCVDKFNLGPVEYKVRAWCFCSNKEEYVVNAWHNHINTSTINSVYYLNMPKEAGGELFLRKKNNVFAYRPQQYDLVLFPNYVDHKTEPCDSLDYRLSINLELIYDDEPDYLFDKLESKLVL